MKKHLLYCALAATMMAACGNDSEEGSETQPANAVAIRLGQQVEGISARAVVTEGSDVTATVLTCNPSGNADWSGFSPVYVNTLNQPGNSLKTWANVSTASFKAGTDRTVSLGTPLYYYASDKTAVVAVAPAGTVSGQNVTMTATDGEQDVMYASIKTVDSKPASQSAADQSPVSLKFEHLTTQLNFAVKAEKQSSNSTWNTVSVKSIAIQKASIPKAVDFGTGIVSEWDSRTLTVPGIVTGNIVDLTASNIGNAVMVNASNEVRLDVVLTVAGADKIFQNILVKDGDNNLQTKIGYSHLITLTAKEPANPTDGVQITTTATVEQWKAGTAGSGTLE